jgi:DNA-binding NarL/FixJ family response regulator
MGPAIRDAENLRKQQAAHPMNTVCILRRDPIAARRTQAALQATRDFHVSAVASSLFKARGMLAQHAPDILVTDIALEDGAALRLVNDLRRSTSTADRPKVLVLAPSVSEPLIFATVSGGADSVMIDPTGTASPVPSLTRLMRGEAAAVAPLARQILAFFGALDAIGAPPPIDERAVDWTIGARDPLRLSAGERYMLVLLAQAEPIGAIAVRMGVSVEHIGRRTANVYRKLQWDVRSGSLALKAA